MYGKPDIRADIFGPIKLRGFPKGINNIQPEFSLPLDALRDSSNIDIYNDGKFKRRRGSTKKISLTSAHSGWSDPEDSQPGVSYYVNGTTLYSLKVVAGALTSTAIVTGLAAGRKVAYFYLNGDVFWSNGVVTGRIRGNVNLPWGVETPAKSPTLTSSAGGALSAGRYQVALTYRNTAGEESGASAVGTIDLAVDGGIILTSLPVPVSADIVATCVYATSANGDAMYKIAVIASGSSGYTISTVANASTILKTQFLRPMPAGDRIAQLNGVVYTASGSILSHSESFRYGLCDLSKNYYQFPQEIDEVISVIDGLYVCADKTYFLSNPGTPDVQQRVIFSFGAIRGTSVFLRDSEDVAWFSPRGQIVASAGGQAKIVTEDSFMPGTMSYGSSIVREKNGLQQIINTIQQTEISMLEFI